MTGTTAPVPTSLVEVVAALRSGQLTSQALVRRALESPDEHAAVERRLPQALAAAEQADRRRRDGVPRGPLDGVPFAVKANLAVAGVPTTDGTGLTRPPATADAAVVAALRTAGAVPCLTTTMAEAALGAVTANPHTGTCLNPRAPGRHAGGSSGGAAAVVAAGVVALSLGSDTMGSVRIPAAYCGVSGWKPARGEVPTDGLTALAAALDSVGVLVPRAGDLPLVTAALGVRPARPDPSPYPGHRVGVVHDDDLDPSHRAALDTAAGALADRGHDVRPLSPAPFDPAVVRRRGLLLCEVDGYRAFRTAVDAQDPGLSEPLAALFRYGRDAPPHRVNQALRELAVTRRAVREWVRSVDVVLLPVTRRPAPPLGEDPHDAADWTAWVNVAGLAGVAVPMGSTRSGLPVAVQLVGRRGTTVDLVALAGQLDGAAVTRRPATVTRSRPAGSGGRP